jgi:hypothetical protein
MAAVDVGLLAAFKAARRRVELYSGLRDVLGKKDLFRLEAATAQVERLSVTIGREIERSYSFQDIPSIQDEDGHLVAIDGRAVPMSALEFSEHQQRDRDARQAAKDQARAADDRERAERDRDRQEEAELVAELRAIAADPAAAAALDRLLGEE